MPLETRKALHSGEVGRTEWRVRLCFRDIEADEPDLVMPTAFYTTEHDAIDAVQAEFAEPFNYPAEGRATITQGRWVATELHDDGKPISVFQSFPASRVDVAHRGSMTVWGADQLEAAGWNHSNRYVPILAR